jgi:GNAT superfamily N-acetyltransferase
MKPRLEWDSNDAENDPWELARSVGVNILSNKDFLAGHVVDGKFVSALFTASDNNGFEFDVVVDPAWQRKRLGSELMDMALDEYEELRDAYGEDFTLSLDVISPTAERMLKQRGIVEVGRERGHVLMTRESAWKQRWKPGKRQRRQKGQSRTKSRQYYRRNRSKIRQKQKIRRSKSSWKNNPARKRSEKRRRGMNRRRTGSVLPGAHEPCPTCTAERHEEAAAKFLPPTQRGGENGRPQRRQTPQEKREDAREYKKTRGRTRTKAKRYYHLKCKKNKRCMKRREMYRKNPKRYKRKPPRQGSVLTVPDIAFVLGPEMHLGYVHSVSPMTGMVTYVMSATNVPQMESLPVEVFLRATTLMSDEDMDAFFNLVDVEVGPEAYEDLDEALLRQCACLQGVDPDSKEFKARCFELVGEDDLSRLDAEQLDKVSEGLVVQTLEDHEGNEDERDAEDAEEGDETISDSYDPHLFYGEVESQKTRSASLRALLAKEGLL